MVIETLAAPLCPLPTSVHQRWRSTPPAGGPSNVNHAPCTSAVPGATRFGKISSSIPCPLVAGSNQDPVSPCWLRSSALTQVDTVKARGATTAAQKALTTRFMDALRFVESVGTA